jgi:hypothetical protein
MNSQEEKMQDITQKQENITERKPDDKGNIQIDCHLKIYDPNTKQVMLETRA